MYCRSSWYDEQLSRYFSLFDKERFHVLSLAELATDPILATRRIAAFLDLDQASVHNIKFEVSNTGGSVRTFLR